MKSLELRVPPPAVALLMAAASWAVSALTPVIELPAFGRIAAAVAIALVGIGFSGAGLIAFRRARTTVNPLKPGAASSLVTTGVYRFTRNPMYVGLLFVLIGWTAFLAAPAALVGPLLFALYIARFQIRPEERVLSQLFGATFIAYMGRVRRWL